MPGESFARGSLASEPAIPAGSGGAASRAPCANVLAAKHEHKMKERVINRKAKARTGFIVSPLRAWPTIFCMFLISARCSLSTSFEIEQFRRIDQASTMVKAVLWCYIKFG